MKGKDLRKIGYSSDRAKSLAINIMAMYYKHLKKIEKLELLQKVMESPEDYKDDENLSLLAEEFMEVVKKENFTAYKLSDETTSYKVFGKKFIDSSAIRQMDLAMQIPIAEKGAMMPDAHVGYGLPIGGVLATKNEVIPYAVGLDIGCRMALSIFDLPMTMFQKNQHQLKMALKEETYFGLIKTREKLADHEVLDRA